MLSYLAISNLAIIERLELELERGLTVITGETGSGKSMLLRGISLLLGAKVDKDAVRTGENELTVEGIWNIESEQKRLSEILGEEISGDLVARRSTRYLDGSKKERVFIAGHLSNLTMLQTIGLNLVNLSSQHEHIGLLERKEHQGILDRFGRLEEELEGMKESHQTFIRLDRELTRFDEEEGARVARVAYLRTLWEEIDRLALEGGEEERLLAEIDRVSHLVEIATALERALGALYEREGDLLSTLTGVIRELDRVSRFEPGLAPVIERLNGASLELQDLVGALRKLFSRCDVEPAHLDHLQERLASIQKARRKYAVESSDELLSIHNDARRELTELEDSEESRQELASRRNVAAQSMLSQAERLSRRRREVALELERRLAEVLALLEMKKAGFVVDIRFDPDRLGTTGGDVVEFLLSTNQGEEPKPLQKIASGGELSRILLAMKAVLSDAYPVPTYVFDEIDAGIGGKTALAVGRLLSELGRRHQVLCITHTSQIAAYADHHLVVSKEEREGKTYALVRTLGRGDERVRELARMLSGMKDSRTALMHAQELLEKAESDREKLRQHD